MSRKMHLYNTAMLKIIQLMSQIFTESELQSFERSVDSPQFQWAGREKLREGVLTVLKEVLGPKVDWS